MPKSTLDLVVTTISASALIAAIRAFTRSKSSAFTKSALFNKMVSAYATCSVASLFSSICLSMFDASTKVTMESKTAPSSSTSSSSTHSSRATGPGSASPVVSRRMKSNFSPISFRFSSKPSMVCTKLPLTVQHTHPLLSSTQSSTSVREALSPSTPSCWTSIFSTPSSAPKSLRMTAILYP